MIMADPSHWRTLQHRSNPDTHPDRVNRFADSVLSQHSGVNENDKAASVIGSKHRLPEDVINRRPRSQGQSELFSDSAMEAARHLSLLCYVVMGVTVPTLFVKHDKG